MKRVVSITAMNFDVQSSGLSKVIDHYTLEVKNFIVEIRQHKAIHVEVIELEVRWLNGIEKS